MTDKEIVQKAHEVHDVSFNFHLAHAFLACDKLLEDEARSIGKEARKKLSTDLGKALEKKDHVKVTNLLKEKNSYKTRKYHLVVDYVNMSDPNAGRVINIENHLVVTLPKKLAESARGSNGELLEEGVEKYRKIMGHELGHVILHTEPLLQVPGADGTTRLSHLDREANLFADELLRLCKEQNHSMIKKAG